MNKLDTYSSRLAAFLFLGVAIVAPAFVDYEDSAFLKHVSANFVDYDCAFGSYKNYDWN